MSKLKAFLKRWDAEMACWAPPHAPSGGVLQSIVWFGPIIVFVALAIFGALET